MKMENRKVKDERGRADLDLIPAKITDVTESSTLHR